MEMGNNPAGECGVGSGIRLPDRNACCQLIASRGTGDKTLEKNGASEGIRTLDTHVGNVMLYQAELRSLPFRFGKITGPRIKSKTAFWRVTAASDRAPKPSRGHGGPNGREPRPRAD